MCIIAVVADVQVGHEAALWPPAFEFGKGQTVLLAPHQKTLLQYWHDYWTCEDVRNAEYVINLAESIEGKNKKEYGRSLITPNIDAQCDAFVDLLKPHIQGKKYFGLEGSGYHTSEDTDAEAHIASLLGGNFKGAIANLKFRTGHVVWATHKAGNAIAIK